MTISYTNPYDDPLRVGAASSIRGVTAADPPATLEPGTPQITIEWTPTRRDERFA